MADLHAEIKSRFQAAGRIAPFLVFEQYHFPRKGPRPTYAIVAHRLGIKERDVRHYLQEACEAVRAEVRAEFAGDGADVPGAVADLFRL